MATHAQFTRRHVVAAALVAAGAVAAEPILRRAPRAQAHAFENEVGQCTWYAAGQFERSAPAPGCNWTGNAGTWFAHALNPGIDPATRASKTAWRVENRLDAPNVSFLSGTIVVWDNGGRGHVAIVESAGPNGITISECNWPEGAWITTRALTWNQGADQVQNRGQSGSYRFVGYIYPQKLGDFNNDGRVDTVDLSIFLSYYRNNDLKADLNKDGRVSIADVSRFSSNYGK